jgi:putative ABC transport system substrate-binding protein
VGNNLKFPERKATGAMFSMLSVRLFQEGDIGALWNLIPSAIGKLGITQNTLAPEARGKKTKNTESQTHRRYSLKNTHLVITVLLLILFSVLGFSPAPAADKEIAVMWVGKSGMAKRVLSGFLARTREMAPQLKVEIKWKLPNMAEAETLFRQFETTKNGIVFLRSSGAKFLGTVEPKVPAFVGGCNNPKYLGAVNNLRSPQRNVTGVTYFIPYERRFEVIKSLFPKTQSLALLVEKGHPSSPIDRQGTRNQCELLNITYHEVIASSAKELIQGAKEFSSQVDLFIIGNQALVIDNTVNLLAISNTTKTPLFSYADKAVRSGAVAGLSADDRKLGTMLADSVIAVVVNGTPVSEVPVKMDEDPKLLVNQAMVKALGLTFPKQIMDKALIIK